MNKEQKQAIANSVVQQYYRDQGIQQLQAEIEASNREQGIAALQAEIDAMNKASAPVQPVQTTQPKQTIPSLKKEEKTVDLTDWFAPKTASGRNLNEESAKKKQREEYQRQQQEEQILAEKKKQKVENPFMSDYLAIRTQNDLGKDKKATSVDNWLDPNYKLTNEDKEAARQYAQAELAKFDYNSSKQPILSDENRQHYADMVNLLNKTNGVTNALTGVIKQPLNLARTVRDAGRTVANDITGLGAAIGDKLGITEGATQRHNEKVSAQDALYNQNDESMQRAYQNAKTQNPIATTVGEVGGQIGMYALTSPAIKAASTAAGLGKGATFALNQALQFGQDELLDVQPYIRELKDQGYTDEQINELIGSKRFWNTVQNVGLDVLPEIPGLAKKAYDKLGTNAAIKAAMNIPLDGMEQALKVTDSAEIDALAKQATEAAQNIENLAKQIPMDNVVKNADETVESVAKNIEPKATVEPAAKGFELPDSTTDSMADDFMQLYKDITPDYDVVEKLNDETVTKAFDRLKTALNDYENAAFKGESYDDVVKAKKEVNAARKNLERKVKAVDPEIKLNSTKYGYGELVGKPEYRRSLLEPNPDIDDMVKEWVDYDESNPNRWLRGVGEEGTPPKNLDEIEPNKVMAEDVGLEPTKPETVEPLKIEEEVPPTEPTITETTPPENGDYVSKFRTHNEQNFNMTDEELNNKYFNTQNENFHFLKGDRAADLENATKNLESDYDGTVNKLLTKPTDTQFTPQEVDEGFMAWNKELKAGRETGDYGKSADIMYRMTRDSHDKGAGLQAYAAWKKNSPAGVVLDANESARKMAVDQFGDNYIKELDSLTDKIDDICKSGDSLEDKVKQINKLMKDAQSKGYKNGITGAEQMEELLKSGSKIDVSHIHDILFEANKVPNLSAKSQAEIAEIASEMYGRELTNAEKRQYINQINMILSKEKNWTIKDKAVELTHILMLSGSKTHLKNFVANVGMLPQEALARKISAIGQNAYKHLKDPNYKPTQAFFVGEDAKKLATEMYEAKGGANAIVEDIADKYTNQLADRIGATYMFGTGKKNIASKANDAAQNLIPGLKKAEDQFADMANKALKKMGAEGAYDAMDANVSLLENYRQFIYGSLSGLEDNPFVKKNYVDRLASYIQAQDIKSMNDIPEEALDIARAEALKATFKDDNAITSLVQSLKNIPVIGELLFPFTKTPANLLARSIDFSPIGLARSLYGAVNKNSRFAKDTIGETIDEISKGAGGTLTMLLGMYLYANGLITGKKSDDPDIANYMANEGWQQYSLSTKGIADFINSRLGTDIDLGDDYYDFSFLQPSTTNMIAAEEVWDELMDGKKITQKTMDDIFNRVKSVAGSYTDALLAQSTLQNVGELFGSQYSDDGVGGNLIQNALEYPTRFTSGAISDLAKLNDDTRREYYSKNKPLETVKNAVVSKLPGLSKTLPAKYDAFGNELSRNQSEGGKWINTLINPSSTTHRNNDPLYDYVDSLNAESTSGDYVPSKTLRKIKLDDETELSLDNKQYSEASRISGEVRKSILEDIQKNDMFNSLDADDRVAVLDELEKVATNEGYLAVADNAKVTQEAQKIMDKYNDGGVDAIVKDYVGKKLVKDSGVSSSSTAADKAKAAVAKGDVEEANKILNAETEMKTAITNAGLEVNDTTKAIYQSDKDKGLKTWSSMTSKGLTDKRAYDVYKSATKSSDPIPELDKWISTYKTIDSLGKSNGHVDQTEFKAYLNKGKNGKKYTQAEAEELARIYGDWTTTPYIPTTGKNKGQWSFH